MSENSISRTGTSSICSNMSAMSVNYMDEEMELGDAIDYIFKELQHYINQMHVEIRNISQWDDRDLSYDETLPYFENLQAHVKEGGILFKDLIKVIKSIMPAKPKANPKSIKE